MRLDSKKAALKAGMEISIHAPVKGATAAGNAEVFAGYCISIHAPVKGATKSTHPFRNPGRYFNPRTREGCDQETRVSITILHNFNPRTREGCDPEDLRSVAAVFPISIHAPVKGATRSTASFHPCPVAISIHAPVKGAT